MSLSDTGVLTTPLSIDVATAVEIQVRGWMDRLPHPYDMHSPHSELDAKCRWLMPQRVFLHTLAFAITAAVLKPFIAKAASGQLPGEKTACKRGIEAAISLKQMHQRLFDPLYLEGV